MNSHHKFYVSIFVMLCLAFLNSKQKPDNPELIYYSSSECEDIYFMNRRNIQNRILSHTITDSSQIYKVFVATNCDRTAKGKIKFINDTLKLTYHNFIKVSEELIKVNDSITEVKEVFMEEVVECDCAYELIYEISGLNKQPKVVTLNDETITNTKHKYKVRRKAPKFKVVNNDTINLIDIYGLKQKTHVSYRTDGQLFSNLFYVDGQAMTGLAKVRYNVNGFDRVELHLEKGNYTKRKYYQKEKLIKICDTQGAFDDDTNCVYLE